MKHCNVASCPSKLLEKISSEKFGMGGYAQFLQKQGCTRCSLHLIKGLKVLAEYPNSQIEGFNAERRTFSIATRERLTRDRQISLAIFNSYELYIFIWTNKVLDEFGESIAIDCLVVTLSHTHFNWRQSFLQQTTKVSTKKCNLKTLRFDSAHSSVSSGLWNLFFCKM